MAPTGHKTLILTATRLLANIRPSYASDILSGFCGSFDGLRGLWVTCWHAAYTRFLINPSTAPRGWNPDRNGWTSWVPELTALTVWRLAFDWATGHSSWCFYQWKLLLVGGILRQGEEKCGACAKEKVRWDSALKWQAMSWPVFATAFYISLLPLVGCSWTRQTKTVDVWSLYLVSLYLLNGQSLDGQSAFIHVPLEHIKTRPF